MSHCQGKFTTLFIMYILAFIRLICSKLKVFYENKVKESAHFVRIIDYCLSVLTGIIVVLATIWVLKPSLLLPPLGDSGVFLYIGQQMLDGSIPYKDLWDHKTPMVFIYNAIGVFFTPASFKGVFYLQVIITSCAYFLGYLALRKKIGVFKSIIVVLISVCLLVSTHITANQTEQWGLLPQLAALLLFLNNDKKHRILIGMLCGMAILTKQTLIGFWVALFIYDCISVRNSTITLKKWVENQLFTLLGISCVIVPIVIYFLLNNALADFWDVAFVYNFSYSAVNRASNENIFTFLKFGFDTLGGSWIVGLYVFLCLFTLRYHKIFPEKSLLLLIVWWFPIQLFFSALSLRNAPYYLVSWIPVLCPMLGLVFSCMSFAIKDLSHNKGVYANSITNVLFVVMGGIIITPCVAVRNQQMIDAKVYLAKSRFREKVVAMIIKKSQPQDYMLVWGTTDSFNFLSKRKSPTKYFYQFALDTQGYTNRKRVEEFTNEVIRKKPTLILDESRSFRMPPLDSKLRANFFKQKPILAQNIPENINRFYKFVEENYVCTGKVGYVLMYKMK